MKWDFEGDYLEQFDVNYRGAIGDKFCRAVRDGNDDPKAVLDWINGNLAGNTNPVWQQVASTTNCHSEGAWEFAMHILYREALSYEERLVLKKARDHNHALFAANYAMSQQPPTEKQLAYLKVLGCKRVPVNKLEASDLINELKRK